MLSGQKLEEAKALYMQVCDNQFDGTHDYRDDAVLHHRYRSYGVQPQVEKGWNRAVREKYYGLLLPADDMDTRAFYFGVLLRMTLAEDDSEMLRRLLAYAKAHISDNEVLTNLSIAGALVANEGGMQRERLDLATEILDHMCDHPIKIPPMYYLEHGRDVGDQIAEKIQMLAENIRQRKKKTKRDGCKAKSNKEKRP